MDNQTALVPVYAPSDDDIRIIGNWLQTKQSDHTRRAYRRVALGLLNYAQKPLEAITHDDAQKYLDSLTGENSTVALAYNVVKSLFTFASDLGNIGNHAPIANIAKTLTPPPIADDLAQRILSEADVIRLIDRETNARNHALLRLLYHAGLRVSEVVNLKWGDVREHENGAVIDVLLGKGGKTRHVLISADMYHELLTLSGRYLGSDRYVFQSRKGHAGTLPMLPRQVDKIVLEAAKRAGIPGNVSAHWLRHSHATHSLKNGARHEVLQQTLGHKSITTTMRYVHLNPDESSSQFLKI